MRPLWKDILAALWIGMILPGIVLNVLACFLEGKTAEAQETVARVELVPEQFVQLREEDGSMTRLEMDTYLTGVVLAEMPAEFELEALKAQAVAARTYTCKAEHGGGKHGDGSICGNSTCCQAYISEVDYLANGGTQENLNKVHQAVEETSRQVLTYKGELIEATYFSCSGGTTESAVAVWGADYPYLQSVSSPGEEAAAYHTDAVAMEKKTFQNALGIVLSDNPTDWFDSITYTEGGGIASMDIGGETFTGVHLRSALGLRSTAFDITVQGDLILITTRGYGHRVGMSQYGADAMADAGSTYPQILAHYYPGTELHSLP